MWQEIIDYHNQKKLTGDIFMPVDNPFASPVVICRMNNDNNLDDPEGWKFAVDFRKFNVTTQYSQFSIPVIDKILVNITSRNVIFTFSLT